MSVVLLMPHSPLHVIVLSVPLKVPPPLTPPALWFEPPLSFPTPSPFPPDRLMQLTGAVPAGSRAQYLDRLQVERERGITVKVRGGGESNRGLGAGEAGDRNRERFREYYCKKEAVGFAAFSHTQESAQEHISH